MRVCGVHAGGVLRAVCAGGQCVREGGTCVYEGGACVRTLQAVHVWTNSACVSVGSARVDVSACACAYACSV